MNQQGSGSENFYHRSISLADEQLSSVCSLLVDEEFKLERAERKRSRTVRCLIRAACLTWSKRSEGRWMVTGWMVGLVSMGLPHTSQVSLWG